MPEEEGARRPFQALRRSGDAPAFVRVVFQGNYGMRSCDMYYAGVGAGGAGARRRAGRHPARGQGERVERATRAPESPGRPPAVTQRCQGLSPAPSPARMGGRAPPNIEERKERQAALWRPAEPTWAPRGGRWLWTPLAFLFFFVCVFGLRFERVHSLSFLSFAGERGRLTCGSGMCARAVAQKGTGKVGGVERG